MWQSSLTATHTNVAGNLGVFLESDKFVEVLQQHERYTSEPPCVLDIIGLWLGYQDNILLVSSYEELLVGIIEIVDAWLESGRKSLNSIPLWPDQITGEERVVETFARTEANDSPLNADLEIGLSHSVLVRQNFDAQRAAASSDRQHRIESKLDLLISASRTH